MKEVDARGLSCPEPLMLTAEALKNEPHQRMNVEKLARDRGRKATSTETDDGFAVIIE